MSTDRAVSAEHRAAIDAVVRPIGKSIYGTDVPFSELDRYLDDLERYYGLDLSPSFQRGHVWRKAQQQHFIENVLRGIVPQSLLTLQFNVPQWDNPVPGDLPFTATIIDGLQRLTAIRAFLAGAVEPFGLSHDDLRGTRYDPKVHWSNWFVRITIFDFKWNHALLSHYLAINSGGTPHTEAELDRVRAMLAAAPPPPRA